MAYVGAPNKKESKSEPAKAYVESMAALEYGRKEYEEDAQQLTLYVMPRKGMYYDKGDDTDYKRDRSKILDSTAVQACKYLAAGMLGGMTSPARPWLRLSLRNDELMEYQPVKIWFHNATREMLDIFAWSNFYSAVYSLYKETAGFGTGCMLAEEDIDKLIWFSTFTFGEYYLAVNEKGIVDTFMRRWKMTARNIVSMFGEDVVSPEIKNAAQKDNSKYKKYDICHCIWPNRGRNAGRRDNQNMEFESVYWEHKKTQKVLRRSGYQEFPILAPRWDTVTTYSNYGEGPGHDMLNAAKRLQEMTADQMEAIHKELDPPMRVPPAYTEQLDLLPGGQNVDPTLIHGGTGKGISRLFEFNVDIQAVSAKIQEIRQEISEGFYNDLFRMLIDRPGAQPPTAREIAERHEEKLVMLSPVLERLQNELLNPLVKRTFNIMLRNNVLPPPPDEIQGAEMRIEYTSILSQAQKLVGVQSIDAFMMFIGSASAIAPQVVDKVDFDEMADQYGEMTGVPPTIILDDKRVAEIRETRAQQQQQAEQMAAAESMSKVAKDLGTTSTDEGTALGQLTQAMEGMGT